MVSVQMKRLLMKGEKREESPVLEHPMFIDRRRYGFLSPNNMWREDGTRLV